MSNKEVAIKYTTHDGEELTLSKKIIKDYLVCGNKELVTDTEFMFFMALCKSRRLNPFTKDVYLIKYTSDPAAIITSIDYFRARARAQADCAGWQCGIIVQDKDGNVKDTAGLVLAGETLVGGFFEATPIGWNTKKRIEVNLRSYIKKTKAGATTRFWRPEMQPTMISKIAESQGLRSIWPGEFAQLYEQAEIQQQDILKPETGDIVMPVAKTKSFEDCVPAGTDREDLDKFLKITAESFGRSVGEQKAAAINNKAFWQSFRDFCDYPPHGIPLSEEIEGSETKAKRDPIFVPGCPLLDDRGEQDIRFCRKNCVKKCEAFYDIDEALSGNNE